jgi:hypothetical protein
MSFAAMASWQAWLVIAAVVAAAVGLFLLKLKPPQISVPSLTLWARVLDEKRERTLWERIRKAVSLAIAVLITLAIALAILRPQSLSSSAGGRADSQARRSEGRASRTSIVIDSSWSMLAETPSGATRWDRAIARARALAIGAGGEEVVLSTTADGVVEGPTADVALIEAALDRISPSGGASASWPRVEGAAVTHFLTDGAVARPLEADVVVESVFEPAGNVAITAFGVGPATSLDSAGQAFLDVANYSAAPQNVRITVNRGNASLLDVRVDLPAGAAVQRLVPLTRGGDSRLRAHVSAKVNALVIDDDASAWIPGTQPVSVVVVSDKPESFGPLLSQDPGVHASFISPARYAPGPEELVIFDRTLPPVPPKVPALFIAPPKKPAIKTTSGVVSAKTTPDVVFLGSVDLTTMNFETVRTYAPEDLVPVAFTEDHAPLIYAHEEPDQRFVVFAFSVNESKLMFAPGFPALMSATIDWLAHPIAAAGARKPGPAEFPGYLSTIVGPDAKPVTVTQIGSASVANLTRPGFYQATAGGATSVIAVNAGDPEISDLQHTRIPAAARTDAGAGQTRGRPWWLIALTLALMLLAAEWWTWQRRVTV